MKPKRLTPRQWALHNFIKGANGRRLSKREISENVPGYEWHETASDKCPTIRQDMLAINDSTECDLIIVFDHQEYYSATKEQVLAFIERKTNTIRRASHEIYYLRKKLALDGQGKLLNNQGNPLRKGNEEFHETVWRENDED